MLLAEFGRANGRLTADSRAPPVSLLLMGVAIALRSARDTGFAASQLALGFALFTL